jgi:Raf kinase inhibitor-like YbhB/YbcL family protein
MSDSGTLPTPYTCDGEGRSPPLSVERVPEPTAALAVTAEADLGPINEPVFWSLWNVPADTERIPEGVPRTETVDSLGGARQGRREGAEAGYSAPCPPSGATVELRFQVYALRSELDAAPGAAHDTVVEEIERTVLASRRITVTYQRPAGPTTDGA